MFTQPNPCTPSPGERGVSTGTRKEKELPLDVRGKNAEVAIKGLIPRWG